jgi:hypothetical protein
VSNAVSQIRFRRSAGPASTPADTSVCPLRYLVALCHTTSIPSSAGREFSGVAKVLSANVITSCARARSATAFRSVIRRSGLLGDSSRISRVFGVSARSNASGSRWSTTVVEIPSRGNRFCNTDAVPP